MAGWLEGWMIDPGIIARTIKTSSFFKLYQWNLNFFCFTGVQPAETGSKVARHNCRTAITRTVATCRPLHRTALQNLVPNIGQSAWTLGTPPSPTGTLLSLSLSLPLSAYSGECPPGLNCHFAVSAPYMLKAAIYLHCGQAARPCRPTALHTQTCSNGCRKLCSRLLALL